MAAKVSLNEGPEVTSSFAFIVTPTHSQKSHSSPLPAFSILQAETYRAQIGLTQYWNSQHFGHIWVCCKQPPRHLWCEGAHRHREFPEKLKSYTCEVQNPSTQSATEEAASGAQHCVPTRHSRKDGRLCCKSNWTQSRDPKTKDQVEKARHYRWPCGDIHIHSAANHDDREDSNDRRWTIQHCCEGCLRPRHEKITAGLRCTSSTLFSYRHV